MSMMDFIQDKVTERVSFLFKDAGDSIFSIQGTGLAVLTVDTVDDESHEFRNDVSEYPVEGLPDISDNIKQTPDSLTVTCFVSNTPVHGLIDEVTNFADRLLNGRKRTADAYNQLVALRNLRIPVVVTTRYRRFTNMAIKSVTIRRNPNVGDALTFDVEFKQIFIATTSTAKVPPGLGAPGKQSDNATKQRAAPKTDAGKSQGKTGEAPKAVKRSLGQAISNMAGGFF